MKRFFVLASVATCFYFSFKQEQKHKERTFLRNPSSLSDFQYSKEKSLNGFQGKFAKTFRQHLLRKTFEAPHFSAVQLALWHGDFSSLPFWLLQKYRDRGLLQVLALSGQHVWALAFCLSLLAGAFWKLHPRPRGQLVFWVRKIKIPFTAGVLLALAPDEPSIVRTAVCVGLIFVIRESPLVINQNYALGLGLMGFLSLFPSLIFQRGFQLSLLGVVGVWVTKTCFSSGQKMVATLWLAAWFGAVMASYFGRWVGDSLLIQLGMGWLWDQVFLPLLFLSGILVVFLPQHMNQIWVRICEKSIKHWLNWEALHVQPAGISACCPGFIEMSLILLWLIALAYWNLKRCQVVTKKNAYSATSIDLTRSARRQ